MLVTKVLQAQSGRVWLRQNVGIVGTLASPLQEGEGLWEQDEGDASVPYPCNPTPAPTGTKRLARGCHTMSTYESLSPAPPPVEVGAGEERAEVAVKSDLGPPG